MHLCYIDTGSSKDRKEKETSRESMNAEEEERRDCAMGASDKWTHSGHDMTTERRHSSGACRLLPCSQSVSLPPPPSCNRLAHCIHPIHPSIINSTSIAIHTVTCTRSMAGSHTLVQLLHGTRARITALHQARDRLYAGCADGSVRVYDLAASPADGDNSGDGDGEDNAAAAPKLVNTYQFGRREIHQIGVLTESKLLVILSGTCGASRTMRTSH